MPLESGRPSLDVMPTNPQLLGFGSEWYEEAFEAATLQTLPSGKRINMITGPYFLACKLAAFKSRGKGDYLMSHDMEDIVAVLDGRPETVTEIGQARITLRQHLVESILKLLKNPRFLEALPGHLPPDGASQSRVPTILSRMKQITEL